MLTFDVEYTDTFGGEANYCWIKRAKIVMPELTHYGYDGSNGYSKANKAMERQLVRKAKKAIGLTGVRCRREVFGDVIALYPYQSCTVLFISHAD